MAALVNEAMSETPDEARLGALMTSMYADYGMLTVTEEGERCPFKGKGLRPAIGGMRCDWANIYQDAAICGLGAQGLSLKAPGVYGKGIVFVGLSSICVARSIVSRCDNSDGSWASGGGQGSW